MFMRSFNRAWSSFSHDRWNSPTTLIRSSFSFASASAIGLPRKLAQRPVDVLCCPSSRNAFDLEHGGFQALGLIEDAAEPRRVARAIFLPQRLACRYGRRYLVALGIELARLDSAIHSFQRRPICSIFFTASRTAMRSSTVICLYGLRNASLRTTSGTVTKLALGFALRDPVGKRRPALFLRQRDGLAQIEARQQGRNLIGRLSRHTPFGCLRPVNLLR